MRRCVCVGWGGGWGRGGKDNFGSTPFNTPAKEPKGQRALNLRGGVFFGAVEAGGARLRGQRVVGWARTAQHRTDGDFLHALDEPGCMATKRCVHVLGQTAVQCDGLVGGMVSLDRVRRVGLQVFLLRYMGQHNGKATKPVAGTVPVLCYTSAADTPAHTHQHTRCVQRARHRSYQATQRATQS